MGTKHTCCTHTYMLKTFICINKINLSFKSLEGFEFMWPFKVQYCLQWTESFKDYECFTNKIYSYIMSIWNKNIMWPITLSTSLKYSLLRLIHTYISRTFFISCSFPSLTFKIEITPWDLEVIFRYFQYFFHISIFLLYYSVNLL